jgi:hypothetical protein
MIYDYTTFYKKGVKMPDTIKYDHDLTKELYKPMPPEVADKAGWFHDNDAVISTTVSMYSDYRVAVKELIDNSLDANADQIDLIVGYEGDGSPFFAIYDNGDGMDQQIMKDLYFLVRNKGDKKRPSAALGKNGMGAKGALNSIASKIQIYSVKEGMDDVIAHGRNHGGIISIDMPVCLYREHKSPSLFDEVSQMLESVRVGSSTKGTTVLARGLKNSCKDSFGEGNLEQVISDFMTDVGQSYCNFIQRGIKFTINGQEIKAIDITDGGVLIEELSEDFEFKDPDSYSAPGNVKLRAYEFDSKPSVYGFVIRRNKRQVAAGATLGYNTLKTQTECHKLTFVLDIDDKLDGLFNIQANKTLTNPDEYPAESVKAVLIKPIKKYVGKYLKRLKGDVGLVDRAKETTATIFTNEAMDAIAARVASSLANKEITLTKPKPKTLGGSPVSYPKPDKIYAPKGTPFDIEEPEWSEDFTDETVAYRMKERLGPGRRHIITPVINMNYFLCKSIIGHKSNNTIQIKKDLVVHFVIEWYEAKQKSLNLIVEEEEYSYSKAI